MELKPGFKTSEFWLTVLAFVVGMACETFAGALEMSQQAGVERGWFGAALAACGFLLQIVGLFGYQRARSAVKAAASVASLPLPSALPTPPARPSAMPSP